MLICCSNRFDTASQNQFVASVAQLAEQLTLNFSQCFSMVLRGLLFRDFSLFHRTNDTGTSALRDAL
jgi:hypothetical protein